MSHRIANIGVAVGAINALSEKPPQKRLIPIYATAGHREWRNAVMARANARCEWPGCGRCEKRMFADHIAELQDGGDPFDPANGQLLCGKHHSLKTARERAIRNGAVL